ncbi:MAG: DUF2490 domain-containing protein [Lentisphaerota bacterium]
MEIFRFISALFLVAFLSASVSAQTTNITWEAFRAKSQFQLEEEFHFYTGPNKPYKLDYEHTDIQYKYLANSYFDVFGSYRFIIKNTGGEWNDYNMFVSGFDIKLPTQPWGTVNLRTKVEITPEQHSMTKSTYNQYEWIKYNLPWKFTKYEINPFIGDEPSFSIQHNWDFIRNRVTAGVDFKVIKNVRGTLMYWYQTDKNTKSQTWTGSDYIVLQLKFIFLTERAIYLYAYMTIFDIKEIIKEEILNARIDKLNHLRSEFIHNSTMTGKQWNNLISSLESVIYEVENFNSQYASHTPLPNTKDAYGKLHMVAELLKSVQPVIIGMDEIERKDV